MPARAAISALVAGPDAASVLNSPNRSPSAASVVTIAALVLART